MKIGINISPLAPRALVAGAQLAESLGFDSVWLGEHVVTPARKYDEYQGSSETFDADGKFLEPFVALGGLATTTTTIRLGTGVVLLPLRDPFLTARAIVTVDVLSGGRLDLGVGSGWLIEEFDAMGKDFQARGGYMDEFLAVLDLLFTEKRPEFHGRFYEFPTVGFEPKPVQPGRPRTLVGGFAPAALRRAARYDGWYGYINTVDDVTMFVGALREERAKIGRADDPFEIAAVHLGAPTREEAESFAAAGLDRLVVTPWQTGDGPALVGEAESLEQLERYAADVGVEVV
ncbi:MAG: putative hybride transferase/F420-dependent dehydrogenase [Acidimicrobiia bacterium]|nr:putative hybride transferase/F420-dependent dehydrogenase [Acidimicrobiia bacterium]